MPHFLPQRTLEESLPYRPSRPSGGNSNSQGADVRNDESAYEEIDEPEHEMVDLLLEELSAAVAGGELVEFSCEIAEDDCH